MQQHLKKLSNFQNLTFDEVSADMQLIMSGNADPAIICAWLTALKMKGETAEEISACIDIMRKKSLKVNCTDSTAVDIVGTGGDNAGTYNISTASVFVAAGAKITVAKHGNKAVSSKSGSSDVLQKLGVKIELSAEKMSECLSEIGLAFLFAPMLHPAMKYAAEPRKILGFRTLFNLLGPMTNPAQVTRGVIGVFNKKYCRLLAEASLKFTINNMYFVHGLEGLDEFSVTNKTYICHVKKNTLIESEISPEEFGIEPCNLADLQGGSPTENAQAIKEILKGKKCAFRNAVILNAGAAIAASDKVKNISEGIKLAIKSIDSGAALTKLEELITFSNR